MFNDFTEILENVRQKTPLIHCITNYVTVNDCANALLACGGSPIMADDEAEVEEITSLCSGLVINIGTLNSRTVESMRLAGKKSNALSHPTVLDPVGAGASALRTKTALSLLDEISFTVLRGNMSEMKTLALGSGSTQGVDANLADAVTEENLEEAVAFLQSLSARTGVVVAATGAIDLVVDLKQAYIIRNGHPMMGKITGTGCMLSAVTAAFVAANPQNVLKATAVAVCAMGLCGERAYEKTTNRGEGTSSLRAYLIDELSLLVPDTLNGGARFELR